jgi:hypothetical protein
MCGNAAKDLCEVGNVMAKDLGFSVTNFKKKSHGMINM